MMWQQYDNVNICLSSRMQFYKMKCLQYFTPQSPSIVDLWHRKIKQQQSTISMYLVGHMNNEREENLKASAN